LRDRKLDVIQFWTEDIVVSRCEILSEKLVVEKENNNYRSAIVENSV
jgi:hypothetical protein